MTFTKDQDRTLGKGRQHSRFQQNLLATYISGVGLTAFVFSMFPTGYFPHSVNPWGVVMVAFMLPLVRVPALFNILLHSVSLLGMMMVLDFVVHSGGINSMSLVWLSVMVVPVMMLQGPKASAVWVLTVLVTIWSLLLLTWTGYLDSQLQLSQKMVPWAFANQALAMGMLMLAVRLYEHKHNRQMRRLDERNLELQKTQEALLEAQAHKDEFVAAVGHELRTPMNAILGFNSVLRQELSDDTEQMEVVGHIRHSTEHLLQVVNNILDFSQLQAGKLVLFTEDFSLQGLLDEAMQVHKAQAVKRGIGWTCQCDDDLPKRVHADRQRLLQILTNLLENALKFTAKGQVMLGVYAEHGRLHFEVSDTGRGIPLDQQAHIFRRFEHADVQTTRTYGGTGLGLSICEKLVSLHGGQIGVQSQEGRGATFGLYIPLVVAESLDVTEGEDKTLSPDEPLRILVVDDNPLNLMVAKLQLQKCWPEAQIMTVDSAAQAIAMLAEQRFDVALVDMIMPDMDGMELTAHIQQVFPAQRMSMPIIALTANTNPVDRQRCLQAGMDAVLDKPIDQASLVRCISRQVLRAREAAC